MANENNIIQDKVLAPVALQKKDSSEHIFTADLLVVDNVLNLPSERELLETSPHLNLRFKHLDGLLNRIFTEHNAKHGDKFTINANEMRELSSALEGLPYRMEPGGSTADIVTTIRHLHGNNVNIDFLGAAGTSDAGDRLIIDDLGKSGIRVEPGASQGGHAALSFIFRHPDGRRSNITYPGNAAQMLTADMVTDARIAASDSVIIPISLWSKFHDSLPEALLKKSLDQDKKIILTIPKQARFDYGGSENIYKDVIPKADVIVADEDELARWYKTGTNTALAVAHLRSDIAKRDPERIAAGKSLRRDPVIAFVKHSDDSATVLVGPSSPGISPATPAARYEISAPQAVSGKKHTLGVDDAMYAGFLAGLSNQLTPQKAAEFAMDVAETKFQYDSVRIPSPAEADMETREKWNNLRSGMDDSLTELGSAIGYAQTGVANPVDKNLPRTKGQKVFDLLLYPLLANIGVWALSLFVTYHSNYNQNKANWFVKRSSWFKHQLEKVPGIGKNHTTVEDLNMVIWSFVDGSLMAPVVAAFESKRQSISRWLDNKMGTTPEDKSVYETEVHRHWTDVIKARITTFAFVIGTYFTFRAQLFPNSTRVGTLAETTTGSGIFTRSTAKSINGFVFDVPSRKIGGWLMEIKAIANTARNISGRQLSKMAEKMGTTARVATNEDARYQIEGITKTGIFELVYTSLCTAGLFFLGKAYASHRKQKQEKEHSSGNAVPADAEVYHADAAPREIYAKYAKKILPKERSAKMNNYIESIDKSRDVASQLGA
jgi:sugar/nucleoside kinase (ribokinase family)